MTIILSFLGMRDEASVWVPDFSHSSHCVLDRCNDKDWSQRVITVSCFNTTLWVFSSNIIHRGPVFPTILSRWIVWILFGLTGEDADHRGNFTTCLLRGKIDDFAMSISDVFMGAWGVHMVLHCNWTDRWWTTQLVTVIVCRLLRHLSYSFAPQSMEEVS